MTCAKCGSTLEEQMRFCPICGTVRPASELTESSGLSGSEEPLTGSDVTVAEYGMKIDAEAASEPPLESASQVAENLPEEPTQVQVSGEDAPAEIPEKINTSKEKKGKRGRSSHPVIGVLLSVFIVVLLIAGITLSVIRGSIQSDKVVKQAKEMNLKKFTYNFDGSGEKSLTEFVASQEFELYGYPLKLDEDDLDQILEAKFLRDFLAVKVDDFVQDALFDTGDGKLTAGELQQVLLTNLEGINAMLAGMLPIPVRESNIYDFMEFCKEEGIFKQTNLESLAEGIEDELAVVRMLLSSWMPVLVFAVALLFVILILVIEKNKAVVLKYAGIDLILSGAAVSGAFAALTIVGTNLDSKVIFGRKFWQGVIGMFQGNGIKAGGTTAGVGVLCIVLFMLICAIQGMIDRMKKPEQSKAA